jgi:hypothetical protein
LDKRRALPILRSTKDVWKRMAQGSTSCLNKDEHLSAIPCPEILCKNRKEKPYIGRISERSRFAKLGARHDVF